MNNKKILCAVTIIMIASLTARSQISIDAADSLQKITMQKENLRQDSLLKIIMRDSLGLSSLVITQIFAAKANFINQSEQIHLNNALSQDQKGNALQSLVMQTDTAIKDLMGTATYQRYGQVMARRRLEIY